MVAIGPYSKEIERGQPDGRTKPGRILRATRKALIDHLGGEGRITEFQRVLVERAAMLQIRIAMLDEKMLAGTFTAFDGKEYLAWSNSLVRAMSALGVQQTNGKPSDPMQKLQSHLSKEPKDEPTLSQT